MRNTMLFGVDYGVINIIELIALAIRDLPQEFENFLEMLPIVHLDKSFHIFQNEDFRILNGDVIQNVEKDVTPAFGVIEALLLSGHTEGLTRKTSDIHVYVRNVDIDPINNVGIQLGGLMICLDGLLYMRIVIATKNMLIWHTNIGKSD